MLTSTIQNMPVLTFEGTFSPCPSSIHQQNVQTFLKSLSQGLLYSLGNPHTFRSFKSIFKLKLLAKHNNNISCQCLWTDTRTTSSRNCCLPSSFWKRLIRSNKPAFQGSHGQSLHQARIPQLLGNNSDVGQHFLWPAVFLFIFLHNLKQLTTV